MVQRSDLEAGSLFARDFRVVKPLRAGGMGAVYIVEQVSTGKQRALKVMASELADNVEVQQRFILEARIASQVESDHIVEIVTAGVDEASGALYLVMELLRGEELADAVQRTGPLPILDVNEVFAQMGHALEQAHARGIVHRDLKLENVFLALSKRREAPFTVKILDFGIAKLVEDGRQKTGTQPLGSPLFMAPEQTERKGKIGPWTDVWALGHIAFTLLTGKSYWREAEDGSLSGLLREICIDPLPPASERAAELGVGGMLPPGFDAWFSRCVVREVEQRFPEAGACVHAFATLARTGSTERKLVAQATYTDTAMGFRTGAVNASSEAVNPIVSTAQAGRTGLMAGSQPLATSAPVPGVPIDTHGAAMRTSSVSQPSRNGKWWALGALAVGAIGGAAYVFGISGKGGEVPPPSTAAARASAAPSVSASAASAPVSACPEGMILHDGGAMVMGAEDVTDDAKPPHKVTLKPFCIDKTEVTVAAYEKCVAEKGCVKPTDAVKIPGLLDPTKLKAFAELCTFRKPDHKDHPVNCVDWEKANAYCGLQGGRLPTEAEWELAARGKAQRDFPWGDDKPSAKRLNACGKECKLWANEHALETEAFDDDDKFPATAPVGSFPDGASDRGVLDLAGNVWEWTADWFAPYTADAQTDPKGPATGQKRVMRGGGFNGANPDWSKPAWRYATEPDSFNHALGFRCAADPK